MDNKFINVDLTPDQTLQDCRVKAEYLKRQAAGDLYRDLSTQCVVIEDEYRYNTVQQDKTRL